MKKLAENNKQQNLVHICDVAALLNGPVEFFKEESPIENPFTLFDMVSGKHYDSFNHLSKDSSASNKIISY